MRSSVPFAFACGLGFAEPAFSLDAPHPAFYFIGIAAAAILITLTVLRCISWFYGWIVNSYINQRPMTTSDVVVQLLQAQAVSLAEIRKLMEPPNANATEDEGVSMLRAIHSEIRDSNAVGGRRTVEIVDQIQKLQALVRFLVESQERVNAALFGIQARPSNPFDEAILKRAKEFQAIYEMPEDEAMARAKAEVGAAMSGSGMRENA